MKNAALENLSSLINNSGALAAPRRGAANALRNSERVREIVELTAGDVWTKKPASITLDPQLSLADKAVWEAVALLEFIFKKCTEPVDVIAAVASVSRRQAVTSIGILLNSGRLAREKAPRRNLPDTLTTVSQARPRDSAAGAVRCSRCKTQRPVGPVGVCVVCRKQERADDEVKRFLEGGPAPYELVYLKLTSNGSTCGRRAIQRAYIKATTPERASA